MMEVQQFGFKTISPFVKQLIVGLCNVLAVDLGCRSQKTKHVKECVMFLE